MVAPFALMWLRDTFRRLKVLLADSAYGGNGLPGWGQDFFGWTLQTVLRPVEARGFVVLPRRWIVERTFAWLGRFRRHRNDYERLPGTSESMIYANMAYLLSRRLARLKKLNFKTDS